VIRVLFLTALMAGLFVAGCGGSPKASFYTLSPDASLQPLAGSSSLRLVVGPVTVPELVDRPQIVTRRAPNEVWINEFARWGEPLKENIARTLAADLSALLGSPLVTVFSPGADVKAFQLRVDVMRFDAMPGEEVVLDALWTVRGPDGAARFDGHSVVHVPTDGDGFDAVARGYSRAIAQMGREIAAGILRKGA
jgi:uncharacterized protein